MKDQLGDRMKKQYEDRTRYSLPRRTNTIIRIDGKAFHTYTRSLAKPFDEGLMSALDISAVTLCEQAMGVRCAYGQSDEYSFLLQDFRDINTEAWFDGNIQKICSVAASIFTARFNEVMGGDHSATFDARVFTIPDIVEVENYFIWRQQDCTRNAIQSIAQAHFSPKQLHCKSTDEMQEMLFQERGVNFNDTPVRFKRGRAIVKSYCAFGDDGGPGYLTWIAREKWVVDCEMPVLTKDRAYFQSMGICKEMSTSTVRTEGVVA